MCFDALYCGNQGEMSSAAGKQSDNAAGQDDEGEEEDDEVGDLVSAINYNTINYNTISSMAVLKEILGKINEQNNKISSYSCACFSHRIVCKTRVFGSLVFQQDWA